jgi:hypothetical protein
MDFFLDSNVIIGYVFYQADYWGIPSKNVIKRAEKKYSGHTVEVECFDLQRGKCSLVRREISSEFFKAVANIEENQSIDFLLYDAEIEKWKIINILKNILDGFKGDIISLKEELREYQRRFEIESKTRQKSVKNLVIFSYRTQRYKDIHAALGKIIQNINDIEVILDAHELAHIHDELVLITGDHKDILKNKPNILPLVKILDIKNLMEYNS